MSGVRLVALALLAAAAALGLGPRLAAEALQHNFRTGKHVKEMVHLPFPSTETSTGDTGTAVAHASQTTPSRAEAAKEGETLKNLMGILQQVIQKVPTQGPPAQHSALTPTPNDTMDALWLKVYRRHAKKAKNLEDIPMTRSPAPATPPSALALQPDPDLSVGLCVYESPQLMSALQEFGSVLQTAAAKKKSKTLEQLINGFSEIFGECFKIMDVKYHN